MAKTLILSPRYTTDSIARRSAALELGWSVEGLQTWRPPSELSDCDVAPYGEPLIAAVVADSLQLALMEPRLSWVAEIPVDLRRRDIRFADLAAARRLNAPSFVKPADDKCFQARVYATGSELPAADSLGAMSPVLISEPVLWESEFRCFVLEKRVATLSIDSRRGDVGETEDGNWPASPTQLEEALDFANQVLRNPKVSFPPAGVLDVGVIKD